MMPFPTTLTALKGLFSNTPQPQPDTQEEKKVQPGGEQLALDDAEQLELVQRVERDMIACRNANQVRMNRFKRYLREMWRSDVGMPGGGEGLPNFHYPLIEGQVLTKMSSEIQALFGEDAGVTAVPTKPADAERVMKVGAFVKWVVFSAMKGFMKRFAVFEFYRLMFGRAHAILTYEQKYYNHPTKGRVLYRQSPEFTVLDPSDVFTPGEDAETAQDLSYFIRRYFVTPDELLRGEQAGNYFGITEDWEAILQAAKQTSQREDERGDATQDMKQVRDESEGVDRRSKMYGDSEFLEVWEWYGRWRMLKGSASAPELGGATEQGQPDQGQAPTQGGVDGSTASEQTAPTLAEGTQLYDQTLREPGQERDLYETDLVLRYLPKLRKLKGAQKLDELYPDTPNKRPIVEANMMNDGSYWGPGLPELLESIEKELTVNENLFTQGGQFTIGPLIFYRPASGANPDVLRYEPGIMIPSDKPNDDVNAVAIRIDPQFFVLNGQSKLAMVERITGASDFSAGRSIDRPTAPRTKGATLALLERGDMRTNLDTTFLLIDFAELLKRIWELCAQYAPEEQFFRVTGEDAEGVMETDKGFATMTPQEFAGEFDFELKPATGVHAKEARKEGLLNLFSLIMQLPIFATNPWAQWNFAKMIMKEFQIDILKLLPQPPKPEMTMDPKDEWSKILAGEEVHVQPSDPDQDHLTRHKMDLMKMMKADPKDQDVDAMDKLIDHIGEHEAALVAKQQMQTLMSGIAQGLAQAGLGGAMGGQSGASGQPEPGMNGGAPQGMPIPPGAETMGAQGGPAQPTIGAM